MQLYYRHREKGVTVFRMEVANRQRRIELNQIASILADGEVIPHKRRAPTEAELAEISTWWTNWQTRAADGALTQTETFIAELNQFTDWVARRADAGEIDVQSDNLLTALLDLRQVVVRKLSQIEDDPDDV
ncbi:MAG: hypothetical protein AAF666_10800 [Pseudomonadota bacterium]